MSELSTAWFHQAVGRMTSCVLVLAVSCVAAPGAIAGPASHGLIDEFRIGVLAQDLEDNDAEDGIAVNAEVLFPHLGPRSRDPLDIFLSPRPHIGAQINTEGDTSLGYFGLTWDIPLSDIFFIEASFGGAVHDGPTDDSGDSFGCSINFRESASIGVALTDNWRLLATVSHMSNAGLCDENSGLTSGGVQLGYRW
jgi:lipid A 3-O-deacylase